MSEQCIAKKNLKRLGIVAFLASFSVLTPVITLLYNSQNLGYGDIVLISTISTIVIWILEFPTSVLADTVGRIWLYRISMLSNVLKCLSLVIFFNYFGFMLSAIFVAIHFSFWSGTDQAFLDDNLRLMHKSSEYGKRIGHFLFLGQIPEFILPFCASILLLLFNQVGFQVMAWIDLLASMILLIFSFQLVEVREFNHSTKIKTVMRESWKTARNALSNTFKNSRIKLILAYRVFSNHVSYFPLLILPFLNNQGMPGFWGGIIMAFSALLMMVSTKFAYKVGEKISYGKLWITASITQGVILIIASCIWNWEIMVILFLIFQLAEGAWYPAWNHVLVGNCEGISVATTRSIIFSIFALYTTVGKLLLASFSFPIALLISGGFVLLSNSILAPKISKL